MSTVEATSATLGGQSSIVKKRPDPYPRGSTTTSTANYRASTLSKLDLAVQKKSDVCGGEPCIGGTRITVRTLFQLHRQGESIDQLAQVFSLQPWQVEAALVYAKRNHEEIDDLIQENARA